MHKKTKTRLVLIGSFFILILTGTYLVLYNLSSNISFFVTPTEQLMAKNIQDQIKLGGYVKIGSLKTMGIDEIEFEITDRVNNVKVRYQGFISTIFREEQGVVVIGKYDFASKTFIAKELLAKHDEKYRPKNSKI